MDAADDLSPVDERELVDRARSDPKAFAALYRHHLPMIHRFHLRRTGSVALAEDLTAATFEKALRALPGYAAGDSGFGAWLHRIAANELIDHHRRRGRELRSVTRSAMNLVDDRHEPDPGQVVDGGLGRLRAALDRIDERYRTVLGLRYFSDLDHDGAVAASGLGRRHFAVVLHRARQALRRELDRQEVTP